MLAEKEGEVLEIDLGLLRDETEEEIKYLKRKPKIRDKEVYILSKQFFRKLLELDYETTYEELIEELNKIYIDKDFRKEIEAFIINIGQIEYSKKKFSTEELKVLLDELKHIAKELIHVHRQKGFLAKILIKLGVKKDTKKTTIGSLKEEIKKEEEEIEEKVAISDLRDALIASEKAMDEERNEEKAKKLYQEAMKIYSTLSKKQQDSMYSEIMRTYKHLS